jgi:hypothetical protein
MSENVEVKLEVKGAEQASSDINKETTALKALEAQSTKTAKATDAVDKSSKTASANMGQFGSTIGLAGQAIGKINPQLGQLTSMAGSATGAMQSLASTGFNAVGIAVAAVSLALTVGVQAWQAYADAERDAEKVEREINNNLIANANSLDSIIAEQRTTRANQERHARIQRGEATTAEYTAERERLNRQLAAMNGTALEGGAEMTRILGERLNLETHMTTTAIQARADAVYAIEDAAAARLATASADRAQQAAEALARQAASERSARASAAAARRRERAQEAVAAAEAQRKIDDERKKAEQDVQDKLAIIAADAAAALDAERIKANATAQGRLDTEAAMDLARIDIRLAEGARLYEQDLNDKADRAKQEEEILGSVSGAHKLMGDIVSAAAGSSAKSQKVATQVMAAAAMTEAIVQGAIEVARAAASYPDIAGMVTHGVAAASYAVAATKAGIVAGGGGGAAGSGVPSAAAQSGGGTKSVGGGPSSSSGSSSKGGDTIIINWGSSGLVYAADRDQLGRDMDRMITDARGRLGRTGA